MATTSSNAASSNKPNPLALDLIKKMLTFNPHKRISVAEALAHPYLAALNVKEDVRTRSPPLRWLSLVFCVGFVSALCRLIVVFFLFFFHVNKQTPLPPPFDFAFEKKAGTKVGIQSTIFLNLFCPLSFVSRFLHTACGLCQP